MRLDQTLSVNGTATTSNNRRSATRILEAAAAVIQKFLYSKAEGGKDWSSKRGSFFFCFQHFKLFFFLLSPSSLFLTAILQSLHFHHYGNKFTHQHSELFFLYIDKLVCLDWQLFFPETFCTCMTFRKKEFLCFSLFRFLFFYFLFDKQIFFYIRPFFLELFFGFG